MDEVTRFIEDVKAIDPHVGPACANGGSYRLHLVVAAAFKGAVPYVDRDGVNVATRIGNDLYDVRGKIGAVGKRDTDAYHRMTVSELESLSAAVFPPRRAVAV